MSAGDLVPRVTSPHLVAAFAWIMLAAASGDCQSSSGVQTVGCPTFSHQTAVTDKDASGAIRATSPALFEVRASSFPELARAELRVRSFRSRSDYFRARFSLSRFLLLMPMRYFVDINPALFLSPPASDGVCAILAHELAHLVSLSRGNRIRRLGLVRLISRRYTVKFERRADLEAIHRGYGDGLKTYRTWAYSHIPPSKLQEKRQNYFSPEEITAIEVKLQEQPGLFHYWSMHVPTNLEEIQRTR
jgi:hypothetical protein